MPYNGFGETKKRKPQMKFPFQHKQLIFLKKSRNHSGNLSSTTRGTTPDGREQVIGLELHPPNLPKEKLNELCF
jgi:hypothetical protein